MQEKEIIIRRGNHRDISPLLELIKALAIYEKAPEEVVNTEEQLLKDGFGENPLYGFFMAEVEGKPVGFALYYFRYSTWKGKSLFLEDLFVKKEFRKMGIGKLLFDEIITQAKKDDCNRVNWQVLDWNTPAIDFYKRIGAELDGEWINCFLDDKQIENWTKS